MTYHHFEKRNDHSGEKFTVTLYCSIFESRYINMRGDITISSQ
jgi:hypothetical protein